jgi:protein-disulfide isomerase
MTSHKSSWKEWALNGLTAILVGVALLTTGGMVRTRYQEYRAKGELFSHSANWKSFASPGAQLSGRAAAPLTVVVFTDYQCAACKQFLPVLDSIQAMKPDSVAVIIRHYPLRQHIFAWSAALLAECASRQGKFAAMHARIFAAQDSLGAIPWMELGREAGVRDTSALAACLKSPAAISRLVADTVAGHALSIQGTPTTLINDVRFTGALSVHEVVKAMSYVNAH